MRVAAGELEVAYDDVGTGPPVVFVHGGLGNRAMWRPQVQALSAAWRCLPYDLRGHGETAGGEHVEAFTPAILRDDLAAFADALGLERFSLVGLSVGGFVAQEFAIAQPQRLERLVLADTWVVTVTSDLGRDVGRLLTPVVEGALRVLGTGPLAYVAGRALGDGHGPAAELVREATAGTDRQSAIRVWRGLGAHDTRARLPQISTPTLVIAGERDRNLGQAKLLRDLIEGAELTVLPDAGHITNLHQPERFTAELERFLNGRPVALP